MSVEQQVYNMLEKERVYISVILPIKFRGDITYSVPVHLSGRIKPGCMVKVDFAGKLYVAVITQVHYAELGNTGCEKIAENIVYKDIIDVEDSSHVLPEALKFWEQVALYYMCTVGEVYKAAYPMLVLRQSGVKSRNTAAAFFKSLGNDVMLPELSVPQNKAYTKIRQLFGWAKKEVRDASEREPIAGVRENNVERPGLPVLLHGVTGSGKTEMYINLAYSVLMQGRSVLFMVPEIAISKQLQVRLKKVFGGRLLVYHSKQTAAEKARIYKIVSRQFLNEHIEKTGASVTEAPNDAVIVLGTRSALFLPYANLGLVIADEEHDSSYKQTEPAPRYNARDAAVMLAKIHGANVLLGSATPSLESEYNCLIGRFAKVSLFEKYYGAMPPIIEIADTIWARKSGQMKGSFTQKLINEIKKTLERGRQVIILRNRRSYAPVVECTECGTIPKCPNCNVNLSYHKYNGTLRCHYCDYTLKFSGMCPKCGLDTLECKGTGTERIEEELSALFPNSRIARFDADVAESKRREEAVIKAFSNRDTDILVGTQMLSKGFDFESLDLVAVLQADTILGIQDFRADERALQMFSQLMGRTGRRGRRGKILIQTNQKNHPVLQQLKKESAMQAVGQENGTDMPESETSFILSLMQERKEFGFAPYVRMVKIIIKHKDKEKLESLCCKVGAVLQQVPCKEITGPFVPVVDKVRGEWLKCYYIKFLRDKALVANKRKLLEAIESLKAHNAIIIDVDPL